MQLQNELEIYNIIFEEDEYLCNIDIPESEGHHKVVGLEPEIPDIMQLLKTQKVNIGREEDPKFATIGDYWDANTVSKITKLLCEYQELFPTKFSEMKGILGDLGVMRIPLKPNVKPVKQRSYRLNPKYKEKVKDELERMLTAGIIEPVKESEWVSPMIVHEKNTNGEIKICVDLTKINDACVHEPFPTPFIDEILDNVGGHEAYSFTDGFSGYHHIRIAPEDRHNTSFATEWGLFHYMVMPFGLKNAPAIFKEYIHKFLEAYFDDWRVFGLLKKDIASLRPYVGYM